MWTSVRTVSCSCLLLICHHFFYPLYINVLFTIRIYKTNVAPHVKKNTVPRENYHIPDPTRPISWTVDWTVPKLSKAELSKIRPYDPNFFWVAKASPGRTAQRHPSLIQSVLAGDPPTHLLGQIIIVLIQS